MNEKQVTWSPWHGCKKCSAGCQNCFVFAMDKRYGRDTSDIHKTKTSWDIPVQRNRDGSWKHPSGTRFKTCFTSDFFLREADEWRDDAWSMIKSRPDCEFIIATKRIDRAKQCLPDDWGTGYDNVIIAVSCENQEMADFRIPYFINIPMKHRWVFVSPMLEYVDLVPYLKTGKIEKVLCGGECCKDARECRSEWVEKLCHDATFYNLPFEFHQTGSNFIYNGERVKYSPKTEYSNANRLQEYLLQKYKGGN